MAVMKKVFKSPFVLDVLNIPGVLKSFERLAELLSKIQKALGEYLERERASFPRFYFVGDEDLLEIIGNSKDVLRVTKHLKKMFAGISTLLFDDDVSQIEGMASREGEDVRFAAPIVLKDYAKINDWLAKLESQMRTSLALTLASAVDDLDRIYTLRDTLERDAFLAWAERYPAQVVVLGVQVIWTRWVDQVLKEPASGQTALGPVLDAVLKVLDVLADVVLGDLAPIMRRKCEHLITELVHQRDVIRQLQRDGVSAPDDFHWLGHMRFYLDPANPDPVGRMTVHMADATFPYGFEYLGVQDRLVQTPLTDRCYLTLTQALHGRLGGSPFGPAGTGAWRTACASVRLMPSAQARPSRSRRWAIRSVASSSSSAATRRLTFRPWDASLSASAKSEPGAASTRPTVSRSASSARSHSKSRASNKA